MRDKIKYNAYMREWRNKNIEVVREKERERRKKSYHESDDRRNYNREWRRKYREANREKLNKEQRDRIKRGRDWWAEYRSRMSCSVCGENHHACLDFHHTNPEEKEFRIGDKVGLWKHERIVKEVEKCVVLCSNCHKKLHYEMKHNKIAGAA